MIKHSRFAKETALIMVAAVSLKKLPLIFGFHSFCDNRPIRAMCQDDEGMHRRSITAVNGNITRFIVALTDSRRATRNACLDRLQVLIFQTKDALVQTKS